MKAGVEKEAKEDEEIYQKMKCWCDTNREEKTAAVEAAEQSIDDLTSAIEEYIAHMAELKTEIPELEAALAEHTKALATATAQREKDKAEFEEMEADSIEARGALMEAIKVLGKVQLAQTNKTAQAQVLLQVKGIVTRAARRYRDLMQADFWDMLSSIGDTVQADGDGFLPARAPRVLTGLEQEPEAPIAGGGAAAGAKSYNSRSGQIFGILKQMLETFGKDLAEAQKEELRAMISFQNLKAAKQQEIDAATKLLNQKSEELAKATA